MNTGRKRSALSYIPGLNNNAVLQLIIASGVLYVMLGMTWAILMIVYSNGNNFTQYFVPAIGLPTIAEFKHHWWTIFTYGWFHYPNGFWEVLSNMLWLYCFGSVVQMLVGHKQIIPLYAYSLIAGGVFYLLAQLLPGELGKCPPHIMGPRAGLVGMAAAALALTPRYKFYLTETFSISLILVACIFGVLMIFNTGFYLPVVIMLVGGGVMGLGYVKLLKAGYRPGDWMYGIFTKLETLVTPNEETIRRKRERNTIEFGGYQSKTTLEKRVDEILDKINQKGYNSLSAEEKEILMKAGKED